jgi:hypothetical protein
LHYLFDDLNLLVREASMGRVWLLGVFFMMTSGCVQQEPIDPMECYQHRPEDCLAKAGHLGCHLVPVKNAFVYDPVKDCRERESFVCAPDDQEAHLGSIGLGETVELRVSPDGRCFTSSTIGNTWGYMEYDPPAVTCRSNAPMCGDDQDPRAATDLP